MSIHPIWIVLAVLLAKSPGKHHSSRSPAYPTFTGCCGSSAAVSVNEQLFLMADDEENRIRLYNRDQPGPALNSWDFSSNLALSRKDREADIEGAARIGNQVFWIGSHGRSQSGELRQARHCFFATEIQSSPNGPELKFVGRPYRNLITDLVRDSRYDFAGLRSAAQKPPKSQGGLNIEALCARAGEGVWIGFRNPIPKGKALLAPLLNPSAVVQGQVAVFGDPVLLELSGFGLRDMVWDGKQYWILAGPKDSHDGTSLYSWSGSLAENPSRSAKASVHGMNPEALILSPKGDQSFVTLLSDDSGRVVRGKSCADLPAASRSFRSFDFRPGD